MYGKMLDTVSRMVTISGENHEDMVRAFVAAIDFHGLSPEQVCEFGGILEDTGHLLRSMGLTRLSARDNPPVKLGERASGPVAGVIGDDDFGDGDGSGDGTASDG